MTVWSKGVYMLAMIQKMIDKSVRAYFAALPDDKIVQIGSRIMSAEGLTDNVYRKIVESASGDRVVTIYFNGGDMAIISNSQQQQTRGVAW